VFRPVKRRRDTGVVRHGSIGQKRLSWHRLLLMACDLKPFGYSTQRLRLTSAFRQQSPPLSKSPSPAQSDRLRTILSLAGSARLPA
jgi:hypothetical protein